MSGSLQTQASIALMAKRTMVSETARGDITLAATRRVALALRRRRFVPTLRDARERHRGSLVFSTAPGARTVRSLAGAAVLENRRETLLLVRSRSRRAT